MEFSLRLTSHPCQIQAPLNQITAKYDFFNRYTKRQSKIANRAIFYDLIFSNRDKISIFQRSFLNASTIFCIPLASARTNQTADAILSAQQHPQELKPSASARFLPSPSLIMTRPISSPAENKSLTAQLPKFSATQKHHMTPSHSSSHLCSAAFLLALALALCGSASATDLKQQTISAFDHYVALSEAQINSSLSPSPGDPAPFLWVDSEPSAQRPSILAQLHAGQVVVARLTTLDNGKPIPVPGGMIHHWIGTVFIPGATLAQTLALVQDYDHHAEYYRPQVIASKLLARDGNDFRIYLRLYEKKILTCVLDTRHEVHYAILDATRAWSRSRTTEIREVTGWKASDEHDLPAGHDDGFLWRMNTYWRFEQRDGGVYVECQSISLTRDIPAGLGWLIGPFVESIPRESLEFSLGATRKALLARILPNAKKDSSSVRVHSSKIKTASRDSLQDGYQKVVIARNTSGKPFRSLFTRLLAAEKNTISCAVPVSTGLSDCAFPGSPVEDTLTSAVFCVQPVLNPLHVLRTYTLSTPFVLVAVKFDARDENAMNCDVAPMFGDSHSPFAGDVPSVAMDTSDVVGVQTLPCPVQRSRRYIC